MRSTIARTTVATFALSIAAGLLLSGCSKSVSEQKQDALDAAAEDACARDFDWSTYDSYNVGENLLKDIAREASRSATEEEAQVGHDELATRMKSDCPEVIAGHDDKPADPELAEPEPVDEAEEPEPVEEDDLEPDLGSLDPDLVARGLTRQDVVDLGRMADVTGYGLSPSTPLSFEQATNFAYVIVGVCDEAAMNDDWEDRIEEDMSMGAPYDMASQMNYYMRDVFCPKLK